MSTPSTPWQTRAANAVGLPMSPSDVLELARQHIAYCDRELPADFEAVPPQDKETLFRGVARYLEEMGPIGKLNGLYVAPTGGSGIKGHSVFIAGSDDNRIQRNWLGNNLKKVGLIPESAMVLNLFLSQKMYRSLEILNDFCEQAGATVLPMGSHSENRLAYLAAKEFQANLLTGLPTRLVDFALFLLENNLTLGITRILYAGDCIRQVQSKVLQRAFPEADIVSLFGSAEAGIWGYHKACDPANVFHFDPRMMHVEILDCEEDGSGEMVLTHLVRRRFPLLRYRSGDRIKWVSQGSDHSSFQLLGRSAGSFAMGENYLDLTSLAPYLEGLLAYQLVLSQECSSDLLELRIVPPADWQASQRSGFERSVRAFLEKKEILVDSRLQLRCCTMDQLERSPTSDKIKPIIDRR